MKFLKLTFVGILAAFVFIAILVVVVYIKNASCYETLPEPPDDKTTIHGVTTIDDAIADVKQKDLASWALVEYSQKLVTDKMKFSLCNNFDMPDRAFERGMGYSWQQSAALKEILDDFGIDSRLVHASEVKMPAETLYGVKLGERIIGHIWLKVTINGTEKDVCPGNIENTPGVVHFTPVSEVSDFGDVTQVISFIGSAWVNAERYLDIQRMK